MPSACDLALEAVAYDEATLREQLESMTRDRDSFREMLSLVLQQAHERGRELERERQERARLIDELRRLRAQLLSEAA
jgi:hypothetical protein